MFFPGRAFVKAVLMVVPALLILRSLERPGIAILPYVFVMVTHFTVDGFTLGNWIHHVLTVCRP